MVNGVKDSVINMLSAIGCLGTLEALTFTIDALGQATKEAVAQAAKKIALSAERRLTNGVGTKQASKDSAKAVAHQLQKNCAVS